MMIFLLIVLFSGVSCFQNRNVSTPPEIRAPNGRLLPKMGLGTAEAVRKAAKYIVSQVTDDGWGSFTPRAVVALSFANKVSDALTPDEEKLMMKHLEIHLMRELLEMTVRGTKPSLVNLASYINALYSTCQDPRSFQGHDLVALLRSAVDTVSSNFSYPYVLMSLCIADSIKGIDANRLCDMYNKDSKPGFRALAITALTCIGHKDEDIRQRIKAYVPHFFNISSEASDKMDIYSKALYLQAAIASNFSTPGDVSRYHLESYQLSDGSFGDMLATYSLIPVLLNSSILDLRCKLSPKEASITGKELKQSAKHELIYSLRIISERGIDAHSMIVPFGEKETFLDIMKTAASRDPLYNFLYEETPVGNKVYSLAGIPNDIETARKWTLYEGDANVKISSPKNLKEITQGVDMIFPKHNDHFSFWFTR